MKLIDEKGRLFGKINLIDLLVMLLIVAVLAAVVWKLGGKKAAAAVTGADKKAVYTVEFEDVPADIAEYAKTQTQKSGFTIARTAPSIETKPLIAPVGSPALVLRSGSA